MYLNFVDIVSLILLVLGIVTIVIGKIKSRKVMLYIGKACLIIIFLIWLTILTIGLSEEDPNKNLNEVNNIIKESFPEDNTIEPQDVTDEILSDEFKYLDGIIDNIDDNYIYFLKDNSEQYCIKKNAFSYKNGRTSKDMNISDVKIGDYLVNYENQIIIYRNISGDELNQELLYNLTLTEDERLMGTNIVDIENINITSNNTAIVKIKYGDIIGDELTNETFETMVEFNSNTKYYSKSNHINSVNDLEEARHDMNSIVLDRNTINKKNPAIVIIFDSSDN